MTGGGPSEDPLNDLDDALVRLRRLWSPQRRSMTDDAGRPVDMSSVLVVEACARAADAGEEVAVGDVARFADVEHSTASRLVDRAVRAGLVRRHVGVPDARRATLELTPAGVALRARAVDVRLSWLRTVLGSWPRDDVERFAVLLDRFARSVSNVGPPGPPGVRR